MAVDTQTHCQYATERVRAHLMHVPDGISARLFKSIIFENKKTVIENVTKYRTAKWLSGFLIKEKSRQKLFFKDVAERVGQHGTAMVVSFLVAVYLELLHPRVFPAVELSAAVRLVLGVGVTTVAWLVVTYLTRPTEEATLRRFCALVRAGGPGWRAVERRAAAEGEPIAGAGEGWVVPQGILAMLAGTCAVYAALLGTGLVIYGRPVPAALLFAAAVVAAVFLVRIWGRVSREAVGVATH